MDSTSYSNVVRLLALGCDSMHGICCGARLHLIGGENIIFQVVYAE